MTQILSHKCPWYFNILSRQTHTQAHSTADQILFSLTVNILKLKIKRHIKGKFLKIE